jgi:hypothetical protein
MEDFINSFDDFEDPIKTQFAFCPFCGMSTREILQQWKEWEKE